MTTKQTTMKRKPDVNAFLEGADDKPKPRKTDKRDTNVTEFRQKGVRLPVPLLNALRRRAVEESEQQGQRVTEQDIIITALTRYLDIKIP